MGEGRDPTGSLPSRLVAGDLTLEALSLTSFEEAYRAVEESLEELQRWIAWTQPPFDAERYRTFVEEAERSFAEGWEWRYLARRPDSPAVLGGGSVSVREADSGPYANIGYWVRSSAAGRGLGTRIAWLLTRASLDHLGQLGRVEIGMDVTNVVSARIPARLGFTLRGERPRPRRALAQTGRGLLWTLEDPRALVGWEELAGDVGRGGPRSP